MAKLIIFFCFMHCHLLFRIHSTYTIPRALSLHVGDEVAHPGVITSSHDEPDERRYVSYYQWVGFTLFFQV